MKLFSITSILVILLFPNCFLFAKSSSINYTTEEILWLKTHPQITLAVDNTYPPLNFVSKSGKLKGLNIDLIKLVEKNLGIEIVMIGSTWDQALEKALNHEVDGIINASIIEERKTSLNFTTSITSDPRALVCNKNIDNIKDFSSLKDYKVAAKKGSQQLKILKEKLPSGNISEIETLFNGLDLITKGEIDAIYDDLAPIFHLITDYNINNVKIAFIEKNGNGSSIGLRNDDPVMLAVMNKAISAISTKEIKQIQEKWLPIGLQNNRRYYILLAILIIIATSAIAWNRTLNHQVKKRTKQLMDELKERKKIEKELSIAKEKAIENEQLKTAFLANMSHEIRSPLNSITGFSELLTDPELSSDLRTKYAKIVLSSGEQLMSLINDILYISRIEANKESVNNSLVDISPILDELYEQFKIPTSKKNIELYLEKERGNTPLIIETDHTKLRQILTNLIGNAIKFTNRGYVKFGYSINDNKLSFFVEDTGIGINPEMQQKIFDRFKKVETVEASKYGGTGLGLSICKKLVHLFNGDIWVESTEGKGARFNFTIPFEEKEPLSYLQPELIKNPKPKTNLEKNGTILIVEDEIINFMFTKELVLKMGYNFLHAKNGKEAVELCSSHSEIVLVLMDIKMPVMDGYEATKHIKEIWPELTIIALTAFALTTDHEKAKEVGFDDYLSKPINKEKLLLKVNSYLNA